jgi:hypothetical protein
MNHLTEEELVLYHYGDVGDVTAAIDEHLRACPACQAGLDELRLTLAAVDSLEVPARGEEYGAGVWARIQPALGQQPRSWRDRLLSALRPRTMAWAGAAAALVVVALVAGRSLPWQWTGVAPAPATVQAQPASSPATAVDRERVRAGVLLVAVGDHLERSQMTLSELVNSPGGPEVDISDEQRRARDLVTENRLYRQAALTTGEPAMASVLDDLGRVLVEVANGPSTLTAAEFDRVRNRIEQQGIIFKVRVFGERVRGAESRPPAGAGIRG